MSFLSHPIFKPRGIICPPSKRRDGSDVSPVSVLPSGCLEFCWTKKTVWHVTFSLRWHRPHLHCQVQAGNFTYQGSSCVFHLPNGASFISILVLPMKANNWWRIDASCFMDPCMENFHSLLCRVAMVFSKDHLVVAVDTWAEDSWPAGVGKAARWTRFAEDSAHRHQAPDRADMAIHHSCYP